MKTLVGQKFSRLTVIEKTEKRSHGHVVWKCLCDCGNEKYVSTNKLKTGGVTSCGCARKGVNRKDISGQRFGRLVAIEPTDKRLGNSVIWKCKCDCGNMAEVASVTLVDGRTQSCGCLASEVHQKTIKAAQDKYGELNLHEGTSLVTLEDKKIASNTSGITGISFDKSVGLWKALITLKGQRYYLGSSPNREDLIEVRKEAKERLHGEFLEWYAETYPKEWKRIQERKNKDRK